MLLKRFQERRTIELSDGRKFFSRVAGKNDVLETTLLIQKAFEIWKNQGLKLSPMFQTESETAQHLVDKGFVAENDKGEIVATFSLEDGQLSRGGNGSLLFLEGTPPEIPFVPVAAIETLPMGQFLIFRKAAVRPDLANSGLGNKLYQIAEGCGRELGYSGMVVETVREAKWLYDWYVRIGFQEVAKYFYPKGQVETVLMVKIFSKETKATT
jgi:hypothetical protein